MIAGWMQLRNLNGESILPVQPLNVAHGSHVTQRCKEQIWMPRYHVTEVSSTIQGVITHNQETGLNSIKDESFSHTVP